MMSQPRKKPMWSSQRLPDDIVFDILTRVPVKSLIRFRLCVPAASENVTIGLAYHSHNNDFKILRIKSYKVQPPAAELCTLLRKTPHHDFILAFDVNDEIFREIMLPRNYLDGVESHFERLVVFKGSLALFAYGDALDEWGYEPQVSFFWVMREYGVIESWTKLPVKVCYVERFCGCTNNGGLLIETLDDFLIAFDPETLNKNDFGIPNSEWEAPISSSRWMDCTVNFVESLVLLDGTNV
uniref:F-box domain-containing protein n=1 Tax=Fagus sylvatica TaxID=28930 RepID=A0A2N9EZB0_FAGSY